MNAFVHSHRRCAQSTARARGSILVNTAIALSLIIITLIGTEIGFMYFMKREFQKTADLAALAGAQQIRSGCTAATTAAQLNANGASSSDTGRNMTVGLTPLGAVGEIQCGYWDKNTSFQTPAATGPANAVRISFTRSSPTLLSIFAGNRAISVTAVAALSAPLAEFSVGSKLITVSGDSTLGRLLKGIGLDLSGTSLVAYDGLAQAKITPGGLLAALGIPVAADIGVGELNTLLAGRSVALGDLLNAIVTLAGQNSLLSSNIALLQAIQAKLGLSNLMVQLGSLANGTGGLFAQIVSPGGSGSSALNVGVSALDLLYTSIGVATSKHAVDVGLNLNLLSLATVTTKVIVISPPSIAIGGIGATANNAQVRSYIKVATTDGLLGSLLKWLVKLDLPIVLDAVTGNATITDMCTPALQSSSGQDRVQFLVKSSILNACVGKVSDSDVYSNVNACSTVQPTELINILGLLKTSTPINLQNQLSAPDSVLVLAQGETGTSTANNLQLGTLVSKLLTALASTLFGPASTNSGTPSDTDLTNLAAQLWNNTSNICTQSTPNCLGQRYSSAVNTIRQQAGQSGLLTGLLTGVGDLLAGVANPCTGLLGLGGGSEAGCQSMIKDALKTSSAGPNGSALSNAVSVLAGLLQPLLDAIGASVLTPLLQNVLGIYLGQVDVNLRTLDCKGLPMLVY